jgi:hypothetical protein
MDDIDDEGAKKFDKDKKINSIKLEKLSSLNSATKLIKR